MCSQDSLGMQRRGGLARRTVSFGRESGRQFTGFGRETRTIPPSGGVLQAQVHCNRTLHLGNVNVPRSPGLGGVHASSPDLAAARESTAVNSGSDSAAAATPEGCSFAESSSSEDDCPSTDAAIDIWSSIGAPNETLGTPWDDTAESPGSRTEQLLREEWKVRGDWPGGKLSL